MSKYKTPQILVVGPLPPPLAGTSVSFKIFCDQIRQRADKLDIHVINSAPKELGQKSLFTIDHFRTARRIMWQFTRRIRGANQVLIFANDQFLLSLVPICLCIAKLGRKPCFVRSFGGSLDLFYFGLTPVLRRFLRWVLRCTDGLIVQTELLRRYFASFLGEKVHWVPGYRYISTNDAPPTPRRPIPGVLRLAYVGHVREEKGVFVLLESLRGLSISERQSTCCDLFGPIYDEVAMRFKQEMVRTGNAQYKGALAAEEVIPTLMHYDALVFPSYFSGEGHPGVLIEAMMAGIPVITTAFRSIPEIIEDRVNGLLVPPKNSRELTTAIRLLQRDRQLLANMSQRSWAMRTNYSAEELVPRILQPLGIKL